VRLAGKSRQVEKLAVRLDSRGRELDQPLLHSIGDSNRGNERIAVRMENKDALLPFLCGCRENGSNGANDKKAKRQ
jgi:hypothetical protein